jgi:hypothetical protein
MIFHVIWTRLRELNRQPHWWAEWWSGWVMTGYGVTALILPREMNRHGAYDLIFGIAPEWVWAAAIAGSGVSQLIALLINDWRERAAGAFLASLLLGALGWNFVVSGNIIPVIWFYFGFLGINVTAMVKNIRRAS